MHSMTREICYKLVTTTWDNAPLYVSDWSPTGGDRFSDNVLLDTIDGFQDVVSNELDAIPDEFG